MDIGISPFASAREVSLDLAGAALDGGVRTLWLGDGLLANDDFPHWRGGMESMTTLAWYAGRFPTARIGITAAVLPLRDTVDLARMANTLAHLTGGGFVLAVAPGFWPEELAFRGIDVERRGAEFRRRLVALRDLLDDARISPGPHPSGSTPLWLAGAEATCRLAAESGLPYQASRMLPDELEVVASSFRSHGGRVLAHRVFLEAGTMPEGDRVVRNAVCGNPDELLATLVRFRDIGVTDLSIVPGHDDDSARRTIEVLVERVLPRLG